MRLGKMKQVERRVIVENGVPVRTCAHCGRREDEVLCEIMEHGLMDLRDLARGSNGPRPFVCGVCQLRTGLLLLDGN